MLSKIFISAILLSATFVARSQTRMTNQEALRLEYRADFFDHARFKLPSVKVAVLDNGFSGYQPNIDLLPPSAQLIPAAIEFPIADRHGLGMAQILWGITGRLKEGPQIYLLNTNGFSNFKAAIDFVIRENISIVVYSQNWFFGSNFGTNDDPGGFINFHVNRALDAGVIWLNSAGNLHKLVYSQAIATRPATGYLALPGAYDTLRFENTLDNNQINLTLSWNDFKDSENYMTTKDLDVFIYNAQGTAIEFQNKIQKGEAPSGSDDQRSSHARESGQILLNAGSYSIKIQDKSGNFISSDHFRIIINSSKIGSLQWLDGLGRGESVEVLPPADNPRVVSVGDCTELSSRTPKKPDVTLSNSLVYFSDGDQSLGSSNATALLGGLVALLKAEEPKMTSTEFRNYLNSLRPSRYHGESCGTRPLWRTPDPSELRRFVSGR